MTDDVIERFFRKECTSAESAEVLQYLQEHPGVLEKHLPEGEWASLDLQAMPAEFWKSNWYEISKRRKGSGRIAWIKKAAVAAAVVIGIGLVYNNLDVPKPPVSKVAIRQEDKILPEKELVTVNTSAELLTVTLPDSSTVLLSPGSRITNTVSFNAMKRDVTLEGEARFKVTKDRKRPFTVFAGGLATTALGTEFTILTKNNVVVKLHSGKVKITATGETAKRWNKTVILESGQQLSYTTGSVTANVGPITGRNPLARNLTIKKQKIFAPPQQTGLKFMNTSLPVVMNRLMSYYHEKIVFDSLEIDDMNFTATISPDDSLKVVLKVIAQMNNLQLSRDTTGYQLKKEK